MNFKRMKDAAGRAGAIAGIVGALGGLGGDPVARNSADGLSETYRKYGKEVRLKETERDIARTLRKASRDKGDQLKRQTSLNLTAKDIKKLR